jgi:hypothetical protein
MQGLSPTSDLYSALTAAAAAAADKKCWRDVRLAALSS